MTRYEKQDQIYRDIQSVNAELDGCVRGSPRWFELHDQLHALLSEYVAVPQDPPPHIRSNNPHTGLQETRRVFLPVLWLLSIAFLVTLPMAYSLSRVLPWMLSVWFIMFLASLACAVFASCPPKG